MATGREDENKSWSEIAGEAFNLAKAAGSKITNGIIEAGSKLIPQKRDDPPQQDWRQGADQDPYDSLFRRRDSAYGRRGGLARSDPVNDLFSSIFKGLASNSLERMMDMGAMAGQNSTEILQRSIQLIQNDSQVRNALGDDVQLLSGATSNMTSQSIINGRVTKQSTMTYHLGGGTGSTAFAQTESTSGPDGEDSLTITVRLPNGREVLISDDSDDGFGQGQSRQPIDVEWKEVR